MCCNRSNSSWNRCSCWNRSGCCGNRSSVWDLSQTGRSCYLSVPNFLCASGSGRSVSESALPRFTMSGTIDQFQIAVSGDDSDCDCSCG